MAKKQWTNTGENAYGEQFHFFASSIAEWRTGTDLLELIEHMKRGGFPFNLYKVHLPETAGYAIKFYVPDVEDDKLDFIAFIERAK